MSVRVWTVGHSNRSIDTFVEILRGASIARLVDVRTYPRSKRNPQFDRDDLNWELERAGLAYRHAPELGGMRQPLPDSINTAIVEAGFRGYADHMQTEKFAGGVERLIAEAAESVTAVMCAEASPWHCHRSFLADGLTARGVDVMHIVDVLTTEPHRLNPLARIEAEQVSYPGLL
jgi:uncharacterized protein (DUF488 family)